MHFNTRKDARESAGVLRDLKLAVGDHTVRQLEPDEAGTAYKCMFMLPSTAPCVARHSGSGFPPLCVQLHT